VPENDQKEILRLRRADPRLAAAVRSRYQHWPSAMRDEMLLAIARAEKAIEAKHFNVEVQDAE